MIGANGTLRAKDRQGEESKLRVNDGWMEGTMRERSQRIKNMWTSQVCKTSNDKIVSNMFPEIID